MATDVNSGTVIQALTAGVTETVTSEGHDLSLLGKSDTGGPCTILRTGTSYDLGTITTGTRMGTNVLMANPSNSATISPSSNPTDTVLKALGTTAIARTNPVRPVSQLSTALGEGFKDGLPHLFGSTLWRDRAKAHKGASNEFLNYEFGWLPLVGDIRSFAYAVKNHHKILSDFRAGSGKVTRVGYHFPSNTRNGYETGAYGTKTVTGVTLGNQNGTKWSREEYDTWFKGAFTYWVPVGDSAVAKAKRFAAEADKLFGVELTPEVLWNLAPWSWAADWFSNAGDIISNVSNFEKDSLVLKYGYVMSRRNYKVVCACPPTSSRTAAGSTYTSHHFRRLKASPYSGFNATAALSATQSAILVALGITHMR